MCNKHGLLVLSYRGEGVNFRCVPDGFFHDNKTFVGVELLILVTK